jgi:hypothetical protein
MENLGVYDDRYCAAISLYNPYRNFEHRIDPKLPKYDKQAFELNPNYQKVYDKLYIAQSQGMRCGLLAEIPNDAPYPIFIKPRYGHKSATSKNCYKIKSAKDLEPHLHKPDMMWSEFVNATESMTDFVLVEGVIVYQLTYLYSEKQNGFADDWKYIAPENKPPEAVVQWVNQNMTGYTGPFNVQYRADRIIEVGMRFARSGIYLESTYNKELIEAINHMWKTKTWSYKEAHLFAFTPFYSFKCWSPIPILYLLPQYALDAFMYAAGSLPFYEYYFEPTGSKGVIFFQFLHENFETGMWYKKMIEWVMLVANLVVIAAILYGLGLFAFRGNHPVLLFALAVFGTTVLNSPEIIYSQIKNQLQFIF